MFWQSISPKFLRDISATHQDQYDTSNGERAVSASKLHQLLVDSTRRSFELTIPQYLHLKRETIEHEIASIHAYLQGLQDLDPSQFPELETERARVLRCLGPMLREVKTLRRSLRSLCTDMTEELRVIKRRRPAPIGHMALIDAAYAATVLRASQRLSEHKTMSSRPQDKFYQEVLEYYNNLSPDGRRARCQLTGHWFNIDTVTATKIVPSCLSNDTMTHLFGSDESDTRQSPRNALLLHKDIKRAMDKGQLALIPIPTEYYKPSGWKCIVLDHENFKRCQPIEEGEGSTPSYIFKLDCLHDRELKFSSERRPATRYLYFRFIMSLIHAKKYGGNQDIVQQLGLDSFERSNWTSPGQYLNGTVLVPLVKAISGLQLPEVLVQQTMFENEEEEEGKEDPDRQMRCMIDLQMVSDQMTECCKGVVAERQEIAN